MNVGNIVRITEDKTKTRKLKMLEALDLNPGADNYTLIKALGWPEGTVSSTLYRMYRRGELKRKLLDGKYRYYPKNYLFPYESATYPCDQCDKIFISQPSLQGHKNKAHGKPQKTETFQFEKLIPEPKPDPITVALKEYLYECFGTDKSTYTLKDFVKWYKDKTNV